MPLYLSHFNSVIFSKQLGDNGLLLFTRLPGVGGPTPKYRFFFHRVVLVNEYSLPEPRDLSWVQLEEAVLAVLR
jgi:hypothetical protein